MQEIARRRPRVVGIARSAGLLLSTVLLVVGCSAADPEPDPEPGSDTGPTARAKADAETALSEGLIEQHSILKDGEVNARDYKDATNQVFGCYNAAGWEPQGPWLSPIDGLTYFIDVDIPENIEVYASPTGVACTEAFLKYVHPNYLEQNTHVMEPELLAAVHEDLAAQGIETSPDDTNLDMITTTAGEENTPVIHDIVIAAVYENYPDITGGVFIELE